VYIKIAPIGCRVDLPSPQRSKIGRALS